MLKILLPTIILIGLAFLGIAIKMFFIKGAQFKKSCSAVNVDGKKIGCSCTSDIHENCENYSKHHL